MIRTTASLTTLTLILCAASGCVTQKDFNAFAEKVDYQLAILACEARVDAYEERIESDEPSGIRRDEPLSIRRDEPGGIRRDLESCDAEFGRVVGGTASDSNYANCKPKMKTCVDDTNLGFPACNACYDDCLDPTAGNGTWDTASCPLP